MKPLLLLLAARHCDCCCLERIVPRRPPFFLTNRLKSLVPSLQAPVKVFTYRPIVCVVLPSFFVGFCRQHRFMSEFNSESFTCAPSLQQLKSLKKSQIQLIAKRFKLDFTTATRKDELSCLIMEHLIDEELVLDTSIPSRRL